MIEMGTPEEILALLEKRLEEARKVVVSLEKEIELLKSRWKLGGHNVSLDILSVLLP